MELSSEKFYRKSEKPLSSLIDTRRYTPYDLQGKYEDLSSELPPLDSIAPGTSYVSETHSTSELVPGIQKELFKDRKEPSHEGFDLPTQKTFERFTIRWDLWLYFVFYIIVILLALLFFVNVTNSKFYQQLNYPAWAPPDWVLLLIWAVVFIISLFSLWVLSSHVHANFYILLLLMNIILIMFFIIAIWFTGVIILGAVIILVAILYAIFVCIAMARDSLTAMGLQIPYILFLILLAVISFSLSHDSD